MYSFRQACVGMVDHHTLLQGFWEWYWKEKRTRGYVPGNWKWSVLVTHLFLPPLPSPSVGSVVGSVVVQSLCVHPVLTHLFLPPPPLPFCTICSRICGSPVIVCSPSTYSLPATHTSYQVSAYPTCPLLLYPAQHCLPAAS